MSYARDDVSILNDPLRMNNDVFKAQNPDRIMKNNSSSIEEKEELEKFELSENFQKKVDNDNINKSLLEKQEFINILEITGNGLNEIKSFLNEVKDIAESLTDEELSEKNLNEKTDNVNENLKKIKNTIENTKFNETKPLEGLTKEQINTDSETKKEIIESNLLEATSNKSMGLPEKFSPETLNKNELKDKTENAINHIDDKLTNINTKQNELINTVSSIIVLEEPVLTSDYNLNNNSFNIEKIEAESLKEKTKEQILTKPQESIKVHISTLSKDMILAMISLNGHSK